MDIDPGRHWAGHGDGVVCCRVIVEVRRVVQLAMTVVAVDVPVSILL